LVHTAYISPRQHTNGVWRVLASGAYPLNRMGDHIEMLIRDNGEVVSYIPLSEYIRDKLEVTNCDFNCNTV